MQKICLVKVCFNVRSICQVMEFIWSNCVCKVQLSFNQVKKGVTAKSHVYSCQYFYEEPLHCNAIRALSSPK